jgi:glycosyltransferase involved in cell wall biosynthesis
MKILIAIGVRRQEEAGGALVVLNHARELQRLGHFVDSWFLEDVLTGPARPERFEALIFANRVAERILNKRDNYDVVNLHAPWGCVYGTRRKLAFSGNAPPYVLTMQGLEERYVYAMRAEALKGRASNFAWKNRAWHRLYHHAMYARAIRTADFGIVANREARVWAEIKYNRPNGSFWYIPNGVEECFLRPREYGEKHGIRLLYVGSWLDRKGIYYLSEAFAAVAQANRGISLTVAGCQATPELVKSHFSSECRARVCVLPFVKRADMPNLYSSHDVFVFPSLMEGMPLTLLEAMASGMPVVTSWTSGMADVVEDGWSGLLVPPADAHALAEGVEHLAASTDLRRRLGENAHEAMRRYTWQNIAKQVEHVLALAAGEEAAQ